MSEATSYVIRLTPMEAAIAATVGGMRHAMSVADRRRDRHGLSPDDDGLQCHILGAAGELAVARHRDRYWGGDVDTFKKPDVGGYQVRTRSKDDYGLIIRPNDNPDEAFVLVIGTPTVLVIRGWIYARDGMQDEFWKTYGGRPGAWFVPKHRLRTLPPKVKQDIAVAS